MKHKDSIREYRWLHLRSVIKGNTSLTVIISAVLLLELMMGIMFYSAQNFIQRTMERLVGVEMNAIYLCIRNKLAQVEVTIDHMSWVVSESLEEPDWMYDVTRRLVKSDTILWGCGVSFIPNYYPKRGKYFLPYSVRRGQDSILTMQLGKDKIDRTNREYFRVSVTHRKSYWSEPYLDPIGAKSHITTYSAPIYDKHNRPIGVLLADITTDLLEDIMNDEKVYKSTQRFLVTSSYNKLAGEDTPLFKEVLKVMKAEKKNSGYFKITSKAGKKHHVFYTKVGDKTDWILINILDDDDIFGRLRMMKLMLMLPVILGLFFAWFIVWRSSRNLSSLKRVNAEKERIGSELHVASQIQQSMLPQGELSIENIELEGFLKPAREVGGDLYDYFIRDEKLFFCIGDVSGKGAPSAMLMTVVHALFRSASAHESNPARIMRTINETSCQGNNTNMFATMFIGVLDLPTGLLRYCDAGHDAPFILHDTTSHPLPVNPNLPIGVFDDTKYGIQEIKLEPYSSIFLYTDGLTEAKNNAHELFGLERVEIALNGCIDCKPDKMLVKIVKAVDGFVNNAEQSDDLTMLAIRYTPQRFESTLTETITIKNDVHETTRVSSFIKSTTEKLGIESSLARQLRLGVEEAVVNVISYAYPTNTEGDITINMMSDGKTLQYQIIDAGAAFDPTTIQETDTTLSAEERQIGGLGILLVRKLMDSINYERTDRKNILTMKKKLKNK